MEPREKDLKAGDPGGCDGRWKTQTGRRRRRQEECDSRFVWLKKKETLQIQFMKCMNQFLMNFMVFAEQGFCSIQLNSVQIHYTHKKEPLTLRKRATVSL